MAREAIDCKTGRNRAKTAAAVTALAVFALLTLPAGIYELSRGGGVLRGGAPALEKPAATLKNSVLSGIFNVSGNPDVIVGRDGWLYYAPTLADYLEAGTIDDAGFAELGRRLEILRDYCEARGAEFVFVCVPNKNTVYPEHMPRLYGSGAGAGGNLSRLPGLLRTAGVNGPDLRTLLTSARNGYFAGGDPELYYKTDTHWNAAGAAVCADWLAVALGGSGTPYSECPAIGLASFGGDLYRLLYPYGASKRVDTEYGPGVSADAPHFKFDKPPVSMMDMDIVTDKPSANGRLLVFRDSFGSALVPLLSERFGHVRYLRGDAPYDFTKVESEQPDAVILILAERNLRRLLECDFNGVDI
ncbi:MAG: hypothetical protein II184_10070 [Clostridia bacterium]|nr:hypothetical protein [Clostridia bacterium]